MVASIIYTLILLCLVGGAVLRVSRYQGAWRTALFFLTWVGIFGLIFVSYSFRFELKSIGSRIMAELNPRSAVIINPQTVLIKGNRQGHYIANATIEGAAVPMLVDTGATNVVLTPAHAQKIGLQVDSLHYNVPLHTAGGLIYAARVNLPSISIGVITLYDVEAYVSKFSMDESLLGMSFLGRLKRMSVTERGLEMVSTP